jgi:hypothetical protein
VHDRSDNAVRKGDVGADDSEIQEAQTTSRVVRMVRTRQDERLQMSIIPSRCNAQA